LPSSSSWEKKQRSEQFPVPERVSGYIDGANLERVPISEYVLKIATEKLIAELSAVFHAEDYTDFVVSNDGFRILSFLAPPWSTREKKKRRRRRL